MASTSGALPGVGDVLAYEGLVAGRKTLVTAFWVCESQRGPVVFVPTQAGGSAAVAGQVQGCVTLVEVGRLRDVQSWVGWRGARLVFPAGSKPELKGLADQYSTEAAAELYFSGEDDGMTERMQRLETQVTPSLSALGPHTHTHTLSFFLFSLSLSLFLLRVFFF